MTGASSRSTSQPAGFDAKPAVFLSGPSDPNAPIGVFDSGVGGLTVLRELAARLPHENFVYLGDLARLPYGSKSPDTIRRYLLQNAEFLRNQGAKAIVVACNSASTALLGGAAPDLGVPVYDVVRPGAQAAIRASANLRVGVLGTRATVASEAYSRALRELSPACEIFAQACPLLVPLVEEGWENDPITNLVVYRYLAPVLARKPDALILGCTHYPALRASFEKAAGPDVALVDSAATIATRLEDDLRAGRVPRRDPKAGEGGVRLLATDVSEAFSQAASRLLRLAQRPAIELVET